MGNLTAVAIITFSAGSIALITSIFLFCLRDVSPVDTYGIVIDAGSSHTGFFAYKWSGEKIPHAVQGTGIVTQVDHCKIKGGIASLFADDIANVTQYLDSCFSKVMAKISSLSKTSSQTSVPVYFAATAGMRLMNVTNPTKTSNILNAVHQYISQYSVNTENQSGLKPISSSADLVSIISGVHEGFYSWVGANYLTGTLLPQKERTTLSWLKEMKYYKSKARARIDTSAILDLGGASTQIAFEVMRQAVNSEERSSETHLRNEDDDDNVPSFDVNDIRHDDLMAHDPSIITVKLFGTNHSVKSQSNLCFGMDQARLRHEFFLLQDSAKKSSLSQADPSFDIIDPCMPANSKFIVDGSNFVNNPCHKPALGNSWKEVISEKQYKFIGSSNDIQCQSIINDMLDWETCSKRFDKCFKFDPSQSQVTSSKKIIAISGFYYAAMVLNLNEDSSITQDEFEEQARKLCSSDLNDAIHFSPKVGNDYVDQYCFQLKYVDRILTNLYRIQGDKFSDIVFTTKINQQSFGWALGLMINATNILPSATIESSMISELTFLFMSINSIVIIFIAIGFGYKSLERHKRERNQYSMKIVEKGQDPRPSSQASSHSSSSPLEQPSLKSLRAEHVV